LPNLPLLALLLLSSPDPATGAVVSKTHVGGHTASVVWTVVSEDGYHFASLAAEGAEEAWFLDGRQVLRAERGAFTFFSELGRSIEAALSADGKRLALIGRSLPRAGEQAKFRVWSQGAFGPEYEEVYEPVLSPDGRHLAYVARRGGKWRVVLDGAEGEQSFSEWRPHDVRLSSGTRLDYLSYDGPKTLHLREGKVIESWPHHDISLSQDGRYALQKEARAGSIRFLLDGRPVGAEASVAGVTLDARVKRLAYFAGPTADGPFRAVVDGREEGPELEAIGAAAEARFYFSPLDARAFWFARRQRFWSLFIEGTPPEGRYERIIGKPALAFSPSGRHRAYAAAGKGGSLQVILDGRPTSDAPMALLEGSGISFDGEDEYHYFEKEAFGGVFLVCASRTEGGRAPRCRRAARRLQRPPDMVK
jgi:hypothetical protein